MAEIVVDVAEVVKESKLFILPEYDDAAHESQWREHEMFKAFEAGGYNVTITRELVRSSPKSNEYATTVRYWVNTYG